MSAAPPPEPRQAGLARPGAALKVLVVDDHELVRLGVRHWLGPRASVTEAATLAEAKSRLAEAACDLVLLDLGLGHVFSLTALPQLREACGQARIIVLSSMDESLYAERSLRAGADGYVMKSALGAQLWQAIETVLAGQVYLSPEMGHHVLRRLAGRPTSPGQVAGQPELSPRELEVLRLVAAGKSTREIADALNRSVKTIESHKQALKTKLGADTPASLLRLALAWSGDKP